LIEKKRKVADVAVINKIKTQKIK